MINIKKNPFEWSSLMYELEGSKEHLESLIDKFNKNGCIDEIEYEIQIGHVFAHLNRSWNSRNKIGGYNEQERKKIRSFQTELEPCG